MILEAYLNAKYVQLESYEYIERDGVYQLPSEDETRLILREYLDIPYAKVWWSRHREHVFSLGRSETARLRRPSVSSRTATISGPVRQAKSTQQTARTGHEFHARLVFLFSSRCCSLSNGPADIVELLGLFVVIESSYGSIHSTPKSSPYPRFSPLLPPRPSKSVSKIFIN